MRWIGLLSVASIGVHELRYLATPGAHAHDVFSAQAHSYLPLACALVLLLFIVSAAQFVSSLVVARSGEVSPPSPLRFRSAWVGAMVALLAIFVTQESLEGALFGGHMAGLHGLLGHGGWTVFVFAPLLGAGVAFLLRGAQRAIELAARAGTRRSRRRPVRKISMRPPVSGAMRLRPLARHLAGRAPPIRAS